MRLRLTETVLVNGLVHLARLFREDADRLWAPRATMAAARDRPEDTLNSKRSPFLMPAKRCRLGGTIKLVLFFTVTVIS